MWIQKCRKNRKSQQIDFLVSWESTLLWIEGDLGPDCPLSPVIKLGIRHTKKKKENAFLLSEEMGRSQTDKRTQRLNYFVNLFWSWIVVVWFVFHDVWRDKEFVMRHFLYFCFSQTVLMRLPRVFEFGPFSIQMNW